MKSEYLEIAEQSILLSNVPKETIRRVLAASNVKDFKHGETIFMQDEAADSIYIVISGWVKLYRLTQSGAEAVVGVFTKGRSFGEAAAFRGDIYPVAAEATTECRLIKIPAQFYLDMMRKQPELCLSILSATFAHLHSLVTQVEQLKAHTGAQRVAQFLHGLCDKESGSCSVTLPYDKVLIAGRLGMKPESLSRAFGQLRKLGVTVDRSNAKIESIELLRDYVKSETR